METSLATSENISPDIIKNLVLNGDLSKLTPIQQMEFYTYTCNRIGVDPAAQPFGLIRLQNKLVLYANRACAQMLNQKHKLSHSISGRDVVNDIYTVQCRTSDGSGRFTDSMGCVDIAGKAGETLANLFMKAETKAKRRGTLDFCGLGMPSEEEIDGMGKYTPVEGSDIPITILEKKPYPKKAVMENSESMACAGEDGQLFITEITEKTFTAKKSKKPFKAYQIICTDNNLYNTTKEEYYKIAEQARDAGSPVVIEYRSSDYEGFDMMGIAEFTEDVSINEDLERIKKEHDAKIEQEIKEVFPV